MTFANRIDNKGFSIKKGRMKTTNKQKNEFIDR